MRTKLLSFGLLIIMLGFMGFSADRTLSTISDKGAVVITLPIDFFITICNGEYVEVYGTVHITSNYHFDHNGGLHVVENQHFKAEGIGDFGNKYRLNYSDSYKHHVGVNGYPVTFSNPVLAIFVGKGSAPNLKIQGKVHTTINHNGVLTASFEIDHITCK